MLTNAEVTTLEAFADTVLPGRKRFAGDSAIAGICTDFGAVEAGALDVLQDPATGIEDGVAEMAQMLDEVAVDHSPAAAGGFAELSYQQRRDVLTELTHADTPMRDFWFLLALFAYMAYDSAPHLDTADALRAEHSGLAAIGFQPPEQDGRWRFRPAGYGTALAHLHPATDQTGNLP